MPCFVSPSGKFVVLDDPKEIARWISEGFREANPIEQADYVKKKSMIAQQSNQKIEDNAKGIYLATVSQGGKDGYGIASALMLENLRELDVDISTANTGQKIALLFHNPYSILRLEAPYRILYTMFESTKIPDDWRPYLDAADKIIVPSKWCQKVFLEAGVKTEVVPLGYNEKVFTYKPRTNRQKNRENFTFVHYNAFNLRKGFLEVFKAFCKEFSKDEPVRMIFKTTLEHIPLPITKSEYPNIEIIRSDCFVFPSRGEGFGLTPLEAMATGIPAIVPNAHGITEYFDPEYMYEVKVKEMCPAIYSRYKNQDVGKMYVSDVDDLAKKMRYIYEHQDEAIEKGKLAAEYVKNWTSRKNEESLKAISYAK